MGFENPIHILFVLIVLLLVFGAKRLPELGRGLGSGMRGFKDALSGATDHVSLAASEPSIAQPLAGAAAPITVVPVERAEEQAVSV